MQLEAFGILLNLISRSLSCNFNYLMEETAESCVYHMRRASQCVTWLTVQSNDRRWRWRKKWSQNDAVDFLRSKSSGATTRRGKGRHTLELSTLSTHKLDVEPSRLWNGYEEILLVFQVINMTKCWRQNNFLVFLHWQWIISIRHRHSIHSLLFARSRFEKCKFAHFFVPHFSPIWLRQAINIIFSSHARPRLKFGPVPKTILSDFTLNLLMR